MSKKDKHFKVIPCEELQENMIESLYKFLQDKDNIYNKDMSLSSSILWDVIYLRKIFSKSVYSRKSGKYRAKYNYVILEDSKIITFFTLHHISRTSDFNILELQFILNKSILTQDNNSIMQEIYKLIMWESDKISYKFLGNTILIIYIPVSNDKLVNLAHQTNQENNGLTLCFIDKKTYKETYQIYYKLYRHQQQTLQNIQAQKEITTGYITNKLLKHYGLNNIINPTREISSKLTRKLLPIPDIKIITKNIFDINEIQNRPEYDYDFGNMYLMNVIDFFFNITYHDNIKKYVMDRYFSNKIINYNEQLYNIYYECINNLYSLNPLEITKKNKLLTSLLKKINQFNFVFNLTRYIGNNLKIIIQNITDNKKTNKLILTSSIDDFRQFRTYNIDFIMIKQQVNYYNEINNLKNIDNSIKGAFTFNEITNIFKNINKKYDIIYINSLYINYDFIINSIHLLLKLPYLINLFLSSINILNNHGDLIIKIFDGNKIEIPSLKKLFGLLVNLFNSYEIHNYTDVNLIIIKFNDFNITKYKEYYTIIKKIININKKYEKNEFTLDEMISCLRTNMFYHKLQPNLVLENNSININKHILYDIDIENINIYNYKVNKFITEYNNLVDSKIKLNNEIYKDIYKYQNDKQLFQNEIIKFINYRLLVIFNLYNKNELLEGLDIESLIKKNKQTIESINSYTNNYIYDKLWLISPKRL